VRCLYVVPEEPISPNSSGGAQSIYYDQLRALSDLGIEIHLWHYATVEKRDRFNQFIQADADVWNSVKMRCASIRLSDYDPSARVALLHRLFSRLRRAVAPNYQRPRWFLWQEFIALVKQHRPQLIWAQHVAAQVASQQSRVPVVYVHHDWEYRIGALRNYRPINLKRQRVEERLVRRVAAVVSGSSYECKEISSIGCKNVHYIPVTYEPADIVIDQVPNGQPRIVHFGGMATTANRQGLLAFMTRVWPKLQDLGLELWVVGDMAAAPPELVALLSCAKCTGFIRDPKTVLRPFDIQIIPWEHPTGQRTRLPLAFNHGQVVVATEAAVACYPEARDDENCRLVEQLEDMAEVIPRLAKTCEERTRLGRAARAAFERCFTRAALLPRYAAVISSLN
jgi:glycosyltransferase involved in cell wall biosynthesis